MKILIVDDEKKLAETLAERLELRGFEAVAGFDGNSALDRLGGERFDGVILDLRLPDIDGIEILRRTMPVFESLRVVILSGHGNERDFQECIELGAVACFQKPANIMKLVEAIRDTNDKKASKLLP